MGIKEYEKNMETISTYLNNASHVHGLLFQHVGYPSNFKGFIFSRLWALEVLSTQPARGVHRLQKHWPKPDTGGKSWV